MAKYPARFETNEGASRLDGEVDFTDAASQPVPSTGGTMTGNLLVSVDAPASTGGTPLVATNTNTSDPLADSSGVFQCFDAFGDFIVNVDADNINAVASKVEIAGQFSAQATDDATSVLVHNLRGKNSLGISVGRHGEFVISGVTAIPDAELPNSAASIWLDATPGATQLMIKARDSGGTIRTAAIALI